MSNEREALEKIIRAINKWGAKPGPRSAGWSYHKEAAVNCPRCLKKMTAP